MDDGVADAISAQHHLSDALRSTIERVRLALAEEKRNVCYSEASEEVLVSSNQNARISRSIRFELFN